MVILSPAMETIRPSPNFGTFAGLPTFNHGASFCLRTRGRLLNAAFRRQQRFRRTHAVIACTAMRPRHFFTEIFEQDFPAAKPRLRIKHHALQRLAIMLVSLLVFAGKSGKRLFSGIFFQQAIIEIAVLHDEAALCQQVQRCL